MGKPLSADLRRRIIEAHQKEKLGRIRLAHRFGIGEATAGRLLSQWKKTGSIAAQPMGQGSTRKLDDEDQALLLALLAEENDLYQPELLARFNARAKVTISRRTLQRELARLGWTRKKSLSTQPSEIPPESEP